MPGPDDGLGKKAEDVVKTWLNKPSDGCDFYRIKDQMTGRYKSQNPCDFIVYQYPYHYYIESKATWEDRFDYANITQYQREQLYEKSKIDGVWGLVTVLFASYQRCFLFRIQDILLHIAEGKKSINIKKIDSWGLPYCEIKTVPSRKQLLDYRGNLQEYVSNIETWVEVGDRYVSSN